MKTLTIAIMGPTNAGKSTLINTWLKRPITHVTDRANSTRQVSCGVVSHKDVQLVFYDTPGLGNQNNLNDIYKRSRGAIIKCDCVILVLDGSKHYIPNSIINYLPTDKKIIVVFNKIDKTHKHLLKLNDKLCELVPAIRQEPIFAYISAINEDGVNGLLNRLCEEAKEGEWEFDKNYISPSGRDLAISAMKGALFAYLRQEIPYEIIVEPTILHTEDKCQQIHYKLQCQRHSQKIITLGKLSLIKKRLSHLLRKFFPFIKSAYTIKVIC